MNFSNLQDTMESLLFFALIFSGPFHECYGSREIWDHLFVSENYNRHVRPAKTSQNPTYVNFSLAIIAIIEFDEVKETISAAGRLSLSWHDDFLQWEPGNFSNVSHIHLPQSDIWRPYIVLENSVTSQAELGTPSLQVLVDSTGYVEWKPIHVFETTCTAKVQKFPFDTQVCSMTFEASSYAKNELIMSPEHDHVEFHEYGGTTGWTITETQIVTSDNGDGFHIICSIKMNRNPVYFVLNIFLPISLLSFLNICVFILPVESGEKASFVVTVFLSLAVFLTIVSGRLPENSETIAFLNIYVFISTLLSTVITIITVFEIRLYNRNPSSPVPRCFTRFTLLFSSSDRSQELNANKIQNGISKTKVEPINLIEDDENAKGLFETEPKEKKDETVNWRQLVKALDNACFLVFLILNLTMTIAILVIAAQKEDVEFSHEEEHDH